MTGERVRDAMTRKVVIANPAMTLLDATAVMRKHDISGLPVVDRARHVVGVLSEKDVVRALHSAGHVDRPEGLLNLMLEVCGKGSPATLDRCQHLLKKARVRDAMTTMPVTIEEGASVHEARQTMVEHGYNRLPVVRKGRLVGIVARDDLLMCL